MSIQPYNYDDPTQNTTNSTGGGFVNIKPFSYTPTPAPQPSFLSKVGSFFSPVVNGAKSLISDLSDVYNAPPPAETTISPESYLGGVQDWGKNVIDAWTNAGDSIIHPAVMPNTSFGVNAGVDLATSGLKAVQAFFTPLSDLLIKRRQFPDQSVMWQMVSIKHSMPLLSVLVTRLKVWCKIFHTSRKIQKLPSHQ